VGAGLLTVGIVPYTLAVMESTNRELLRREGLVRHGKEGGKSGRDAGWRGRDSRELIRSWARMNLGRAVLTLAAALVGFSAL